MDKHGSSAYFEARDRDKFTLSTNRPPLDRGGRRGDSRFDAPFSSCRPWAKVAILSIASTLAVLLVSAAYDSSAFDHFVIGHALGFAQQSKEQIHWTNCGENLECVHLTVPLDYANASAGFASLALARYQATNKTAHLGTLVVNPGGPGASGVRFLFRAGASLSTILEGRYDIVSWDPRGVNSSTPRVECFPSQTQRDIFTLNTHYELVPDTRNLSDPLDRAIFVSGARLADARDAVQAQLCMERTGSHTLRHIGTPATVRDLEYMYSVLEGPDALVNFWGLSYGSTIGNYFVNMFPDRVGRVVLDGTTDPNLWVRTHANEWTRWYLANTEKALESFYQACADAGPACCALASSSASTATSIAASIDTLLDNLYERPLPVPTAKRPNALTASTVKGLIFTGLYAPRGWDTLATQLAAALKGDGQPILDATLKSVELDQELPDIDYGPPNRAISCADSLGYEGQSREAAFESMLDEIAWTEKKLTDHFNAMSIEHCYDWRVEQAEQFTGPFNHTLSNPILVVGNTADPVTSIANAVAVNTLLKDSSRLVIQDSSGHCSISMTSLCTIATLRVYFLEGKLPANGTICPVDEIPFPPGRKDDPRSLAWVGPGITPIGKKDMEILAAGRELGLALEPFTKMFGPLSSLAGRF